jgi:hypothetical protein
MMENRFEMKGLKGFWTCSSTVLLLLALDGCGGAGGAASSALSGNYDGTVSNPGKTSQTVEITVSSNGTITGRCTLLSLTSGAIMGRAILEGTVNTTTREFQAAGPYQLFMPPPPDGSGFGVVTITGSIPPKGVADGPMQVQNQVGAYSGRIAPTAQ